MTQIIVKQDCENMHRYPNMYTRMCIPASTFCLLFVFNHVVCTYNRTNKCTIEVYSEAQLVAVGVALWWAEPSCQCQVV